MSGFRFDLFGFPVEFTSQAWLLVGIFFLLGLSWGWSFPLIFATIGIVVVSLLVHELGHAFSARGFGLEPISIRMHGLGGATRHKRANKAWKELIIVLAGPAAGFSLAVLGWVLVQLPLPGLAADVAWQLLLLNVLWSVFNLLPVFPLDGGLALSNLLQLVLSPAVAWPITWGVGLIGAVALCVLSIALGELFVLFFAGMFAWQNLQMLQQWRQSRAAG